MFFHINKSEQTNSAVKYKGRIFTFLKKFNLKTQLKTNKQINKTIIIIIIIKWKMMQNIRQIMKYEYIP